MMEWVKNDRQWLGNEWDCSIERPADYHLSVHNYHATPLVQLDGLAAQLELGRVWVKDESSRFGLQAFKGLGASYAIHWYLEKYGRPKAFCTATDGNHGRAVAWAAKLHKVPAYVYMPAGTATARVEAIEQLCATVQVTGLHYDETVALAQQRSKENGWALIQDTAWEGYEEIPRWIMEGYLTQMAEVSEQWSAHSAQWPEVILLQSGVGSWAASVIWYVREHLKLDVKIVLVEPTEAAGAMASAKAGQRVHPDGKFKTIMAGLNCGIPSSLAWPVISAGVDLFVAIEDEWAQQAMRLFHQNGIESGESGSAGLAGLLALLEEPDCTNWLGLNQASSVLLFNTEGITNPAGSP